MVLTFDPIDFVVDATGFAGMVGVFAFTAGAPEVETPASDEVFASRL